MGVFIFGVLYDKIRLLFMPKLGNVVCSWLDSNLKVHSLI